MPDWGHVSSQIGYSTIYVFRTAIFVFAKKNVSFCPVIGGPKTIRALAIHRMQRGCCSKYPMLLILVSESDRLTTIGLLRTCC